MVLSKKNESPQKGRRVFFCEKSSTKNYFLAQAALAAHFAVSGQATQAALVESQQTIAAESQTTAQVSAFDTAVESHEVEEQQPLLPQDTIAAPATAIIKRKNFFI